MNTILKISIIVPIHNLGKYLSNSMDRIINLNVNDKIDLEIICISDNCTDNSNDLLDYYKENCNVKVIKGVYGSAGLARNAGLDIAQGDWIWFIDGDDYIINPDALLYFYEILTTVNNISIINFNFLWNEQIFGLYGNNGSLFCNVWSRIFNKDIIGNTRFNDKKIGEDLDFINEVLLRLDEKHNLFDLPRTFYFYNFPRKDSLTDIYNK